MRVLQVIHQYPPHSSQGSEVHCHALASYLARSDDVRVFHVSNTRRRRPRRLERGAHEGVGTYHCIDGGEHARVAEWPNEFLRDRFAAVLAEFRPEIVHFHNYVSLGDDLVSMARSSGAGVVYTLHDYGLICPNNLLRRTDGGLCGKDTADFFQDCCPVLVRTSGGRTPLFAGALPSLARWRMFVKQQPPGFPRLLLDAAVTCCERIRGLPEATDIASKKGFFLERTRRIFADTHRFIAPSMFLRGRFVSCGLPAEKVVHLRYGMRQFDRRPKRPGDGRVRFGYLGALHAHKGLELLLRAFDGLGDRATLRVHGSTFGSPISASHWRRVATSLPRGVEFRGGYDNASLPDILGAIDAVVVPSVWYENSPLTIQEAFIGGVPVITADVGGMAELVRDDIDGRHFRFGDAADLRRTMAAIIDDPRCLDRWRAAIEPVPSIDGQSSLVRSLYEQLRPRGG